MVLRRIGRCASTASRSFTFASASEALAAIILGCLSLYRKARVVIPASICIILLRAVATIGAVEILGIASNASILLPI